MQSMRSIFFHSNVLHVRTKKERDLGQVNNPIMTDTHISLQCMRIQEGKFIRFVKNNKIVGKYPNLQLDFRMEIHFRTLYNR